MESKKDQKEQTGSLNLLNPYDSMVAYAQSYMNSGIYLVTLKDTINNNQFTLQVAATSPESAKSCALASGPLKLNSLNLEVINVIFSY